MITNGIAKRASNAPYDFIVIGGGFSGTALSIQLMHQARKGISVAVINRGGLPGRGIAYSTECEDHLLNVAAGKMSVLSEQPRDFLRWLQLKCAEVSREDFVSRRLYGEYLEDTLNRFRYRHPAVLFSWLNEDAVSLILRESKPVVKLANGDELRSEVVILATGNGPPSSPAELRSISTRFYSPYAWTRDALEGIPKLGCVLILGSGLTAVDQILALRARQFRGKIFLLSRHGQLPALHSTFSPWPSDWAATLPGTVCGVIRAVRVQIRLASEEGKSWQSVIDSLRPYSLQIWQRWSYTERRRFLQHARAHWEASRHRVPEVVHRALTDLVAQHGLCLIAGRIIEAVEHVSSVEVVFSERRTQVHKLLSLDRIVNCTGPASVHRIQDKLTRCLIESGLARIDPLNIGIETGLHGSLVSESGELSDRIYSIGPVRKGFEWETTSVPEIRSQAAQLAHYMLGRLTGRADLES